MRYEEPPHHSRGEAERVLSAALVAPRAAREANSVLIGLALHDEDREYVERWCVRIGTAAPDLAFRGTASLCIGHLARRFGHAGDDAVAVVHALAANDEARAANSQVLDAVEDLDMFLGRPSRLRRLVPWQRTARLRR